MNKKFFVKDKTGRGYNYEITLQDALDDPESLVEEEIEDFLYWLESSGSGDSWTTSAKEIICI